MDSDGRMGTESLEQEPAGRRWHVEVAEVDGMVKVWRVRVEVVVEVVVVEGEEADAASVEGEDPAKGTFGAARKDDSDHA